MLSNDHTFHGAIIETKPRLRLQLTYLYHPQRRIIKRFLILHHDGDVDLFGYLDHGVQGGHQRDAHGQVPPVL